MAGISPCFFLEMPSTQSKGSIFQPAMFDDPGVFRGFQVLLDPLESSTRSQRGILEWVGFKEVDLFHFKGFKVFHTCCINFTSIHP